MLDLFSEVADQVYSHSEVLSVETWRSLLLISTKSGVVLRDLEHNDVNYSLPSQLVC